MSEHMPRVHAAERNPYKMATASATGTIEAGVNHVLVTLGGNITLTLPHPSVTVGMGPITVEIVARTSGACTLADGLGNTITAALDAVADRIVVESNGKNYNTIASAIA